jgi:hypothetical protein
MPEADAEDRVGLNRREVWIRWDWGYGKLAANSGCFAANMVCSGENRKG